jgi:hypothetical protein
MHPETDKIRLLERIRSERRFVERTLDSMTAEQMLIPNVQGWWSVKDTLAHPAIPDEGYAWADIDTLNDRQSALDKDRPLDDVLQDFRQTHYEVVEMVEALSEYDIFENRFNEAFREPPLRLIESNTYEHYHEHLVPIRRWLMAQWGQA